jgi:ATP-dependent Clp protease ATP-binding subunit ClpA
MISDVGFDELYGARPIKRAIQDKIEDFISEEVLNGNVVEGGEYILKYESETVKLEQINKKETTKKGKKKKGVE